jgi:5'-nucleotidase
MKILVTNDDGIRSEGLQVLAETLKAAGEVVVVAPDREMSSVAHALTLHRPLRVEGLGKDTYAVDGTPVDCVNLGVHLLRPDRPGLVVSGINRGENMGEDILYSGTVSAAFEGTIMGIPSLAISLAGRRDFRFQGAADFALRAARFVQKNGLPKNTLLNINVPNTDPDKIRSYRITRQGKRIYGDVVHEKIDPRGRKYYWIGGNDMSFEKDQGTDFDAISQGHVSVTPLHPNLTCVPCLEEMAEWNL